jgi:hypothetical protein
MTLLLCWCIRVDRHLWIDDRRSHHGFLIRHDLRFLDDTRITRARLDIGRRSRFI